MIERSIQFGVRGALAGRLALPDAIRRTGMGLLLLNAGLVHRVGPHRLNVKLARAAAARGMPSLRFDLSGRGDSLHGADGHTLDEQNVLDIRAAAARLREESGVDRLMLFGICSGADDGIAAALQEPALASLVLFDPYVFPTLRWRLRTASARLRRFGVLGGLARWRELRAAQRLPGGDASDNYGRDVPPVGAFAGVLRTLTDRGVRIRLVYSGSSVDRRDYETQARILLDAHGLRQRVATEFLPEVDHVVTSLAAQSRVLGRFADWCEDAPAAGPA